VFVLEASFLQEVKRNVKENAAMAIDKILGFIFGV
jgi:hypothetical protein